MINIDDIFKISDPTYFKDLALKIYDFQYKNNRVYRQFCNLNNKNLDNVQEILEIPFLPISFFKTHKILSSKKIEKNLLFDGLCLVIYNGKEIPKIGDLSDQMQKLFRKHIG